jgi:hypothetical protein
MEWLKRQWDDIKGNVKFYILGVVLTGLPILANEITRGLFLWQRVAIAGCVVLAVTVAVFSTWRWKSATSKWRVQDDEVSRLPLRAPQVSPSIACRGFFVKECNIPAAGKEDVTWETLSCQTLAFRNIGRTDDEAMATLDFRSDDDELIAVNHGWWCEDGERGPGSMSFFIGRGQTKHLVVTASVDNYCWIWSKTFDHTWGRDLTHDLFQLREGRWRLTIELTAGEFRETYYSIGEVLSGGKSKWSSPLTIQPADWNVKPQIPANPAVEPEDDVRLTILTGAFAEGPGINTLLPSVYIFLKVRVLSKHNTTLDLWKLSLFYGDSLLSPTDLDFTHSLGFQYLKQPGDLRPPKTELIGDERLNQRYSHIPLPVNREVEDWIVFSMKNNTILDDVLGADLHLSIYDGKGKPHETVKRPGTWSKRVNLIGGPRPPNQKEPHRTSRGLELLSVDWGIPDDYDSMTDLLAGYLESDTKELRASILFFGDRHPNKHKHLIVKFRTRNDDQIRTRAFAEEQLIELPD